MFQRIMAAFDESPEAGRALRVAVELSKALRAELKIITVLEPLPSYFSFAVSAAFAGEWEDERKAKYGELHEQARQLASSAGLHFDIELIHGDEVGTIIQYAKKYCADLLVLGMRRHKLLLGHTGVDVAERSPCPLLGVR